MPRSLPSFLIIGAQKAGTSTLHKWLRDVPGVELPRDKETHFFRDSSKFEGGAEFYLDCFEADGSAAVRGEVDPEYIYWACVPSRIASVLTSPRMVAVFREPLERAYSHYLMSARRGLDDRSFSVAVREEPHWDGTEDPSIETIHHSYIARGCYSKQIERYFKTFRRDAFLFVRFEDVFGPNQGVTLSRISRHLGIPPIAEWANLRRWENRAGEARWVALARQLHNREGRLRRAMTPVIRQVFRSQKTRRAVSEAISRLNQRPIAPIKPAEALADVPEAVVRVVANDVTRLGALTGLDVAAWLARYEGLRGKRS